MSVVAKLAGFAALLVLVVAGAALTGRAVGPKPADQASTPVGRAGHAGAAAAGDGHVVDDKPDAAHGAQSRVVSARGLAVSDNGVTVRVQTDSVERGRSSDLRFAIVDPDGRPVTDFEVEHEKRMHLIVVRRDGQGFQHLHPEMDGDGTWRTRITLPDAGSYRIFADFTRHGEAQTLASELFVDGNATYEALPAPSSTASTADGYEVRLEGGRRLRAGREAKLGFTVTRNGDTVQTEPYLGAGGHLVALREGDLAYLHVHPADHPDESHGGEQAHDDAVAFATEFPTPGRYRLYLQFKDEGRVRTAEFTQEVSR